MNEFIHILKHSVLITGFVFIMMLLIEYINVQTKGLWQKNLTKSRWGQYFLAALLGAVPGCLGAFTVVALFSHRIVSLGALVAAMIATSGDEAFVMFAQIPKEALILSVIIFVVGIIAGYLTDKVFKGTAAFKNFENFKFPIHENEHCDCFSGRNFIHNIKNPSMQRVLLVLLVGIILGSTITGQIGPDIWDWVRVTLLITSVIAMFIVLVVPEHFLEEHLWNHIVKKHIPRIFLWTFATLILVSVLMHFIDLNSWVAANLWLVLLIAVLIGIIPESGPHMIFITLYVSGTIPLSILIASSIVQDGHGMLPLLAESKKAFLWVKAINIIVGLAVGVIGILVKY
jgi:hypothetical protein